jgi:hypothetical protein
MKTKSKIIIGLAIFVITILQINSRTEEKKASNLVIPTKKVTTQNLKKDTTTVTSSVKNTTEGDKQEVSFKQLVKKYKLLQPDEIEERISSNSRKISESGLVALANTTGLNDKQMQRLLLLLREGNALKSIKIDRLTVRL